MGTEPGEQKAGNTQWLVGGLSLKIWKTPSSLENLESNTGCALMSKCAIDASEQQGED